jgi:hypothetical protein
MAELNQQDIDILKRYARDGNRVLYWNYLAQHEGNDGYGLLALGVVRNDSVPGAAANAFAQNHAGRKLSEREWENFGQDLVRRDFALRQEHMKNNQPDLALNLPVEDVQKAHDGAFENADITPDAWTPRQLLEAARRHGGEPAAEGIWHQMLDSSYLGAERGLKTLYDVARRYNDERLDALSYTGSLTAATLRAYDDRSAVDPNVIGGKNFYHLYDANTREWFSVNSMASVIRKESNPHLIHELDEARAVRLERQEKSRNFDPLDPHREIAKSPHTLADADPYVAPGARIAGPSKASDDLFTRLTDAAMNRDFEGMRAVTHEFRQSEEGQAWLQSGRDHNQAEQERQAALAARAVPERSGPVMSM